MTRSPSPQLRVTQDEQGLLTALPTYSVKHLFGTKDDLLLDVCGRQLYEVMVALEAGNPPPLLLGLSLRSPTKGTVRAVVDAVTSLMS